MCGRYTLIEEDGVLRRRFVHYWEVHLPRPFRYNIAPTQEVLAITNHRGEESEAELFRWGLIPYWAKDMRIGNRMINARSETLAEKPAFKRPFAKRRCLILADGCFEWHRLPGGTTPMRVVLKSREPFAFAGLWHYWKRRNRDGILSCSIITTEPNSMMAPIHNPVILKCEAEELWLDRTIEDTDLLSNVLLPYAPEEMEAYEVSRVVNRPENDVPECVVPLSPPML